MVTRIDTPGGIDNGGIAGGHSGAGGSSAGTSGSSGVGGSSGGGGSPANCQAVSSYATPTSVTSASFNTTVTNLAASP